jgi:hypothetical protein
MEFDENKEVEENNEVEKQGSEDAVEIYSKWAIWGFSIFFSTIFGGVLLVLNLRAVGLKKAANTVLIFSILYFIASGIIVGVIGITGSYTPLFINIVGAAILTGYFFNKYFPEDDYYPKSIGKPLIISIVISLVIFLIIYYGMKYTGHGDYFKQFQK